MGHAHDHSSLRDAPDRPGAGGSAGHPLLALQASAGNRAVAQLLQRQHGDTTVQTRAPTGRYVPGLVALATAAKIYDGKCDANFDSVTMRYKWSVGMLANDASLTFQCGPQAFRFSTSIPWGSDRFPWGMHLTTGGTAWVRDDIEKALDTIYDHWDDERGGFWDAVSKIKTSLKYDIDRYCAP